MCVRVCLCGCVGGGGVNNIVIKTWNIEFENNKETWIVCNMVQVAGIRLKINRF